MVNQATHAMHFWKDIVTHFVAIPKFYNIDVSSACSLQLCKPGKGVANSWNCKEIVHVAPIYLLWPNELPQEGNHAMMCGPLYGAMKAR